MMYGLRCLGHRRAAEPGQRGGEHAAALLPGLGGAPPVPGPGHFGVCPAARLWAPAPGQPLHSPPPRHQ